MINHIKESQVKFTMLEGSIFNNTTFQIVNDTAVISEISYLPIFLELSNIILLLTCTRLIYFGIEISQSVYAVLFSNLIVALISSFINSIIFPFVKNIEFHQSSQWQQCCLSSFSLHFMVYSFSPSLLVHHSQKLD